MCRRRTAGANEMICAVEQLASPRKRRVGGRGGPVKRKEKDAAGNYGTTA